MTLRGKQRQTMSMLFRWGALLETYASKHGSYPRPGYVGPIAGLAPLMAAKNGEVVDQFGHRLDTKDGWGRPILYHGARGMYALRSTARDGINDHQTAPTITRDIDADILFANGVYMRVPEEICGGVGEKDDWDVKKYGECAECHPSRVRRVVTK